MDNKIIVNFCPTGMVPTKATTPFVPTEPNEIIDQIHQAYEIGITMVRLHARDKMKFNAIKKTISRFLKV